MSDAGSVVLYPRYCFHLAPTANKWCLLRASEIHGLDQHAGFEGENFYFYKNLPIKWVRIVGVVVAIDDLAGRRFYYVDDSSGATIQALYRLSMLMPDPQKDDPEPGNDNGNGSEQGTGKDHHEKDPAGQRAKQLSEIDVGCVVDIKGSISTFRNERQINVEKMELVKGTARELVLWEKRAKFRREVLDIPWVLRDGDVRRCRREAERSGEPRAERCKKRHHGHHSHDRDKKSPLAVDQEGANEHQHVSHATKRRAKGPREGKEETWSHEKRPRGEDADHGVPNVVQHARAATSNYSYSALGI